MTQILKLSIIIMLAHHCDSQPFKQDSCFVGSQFMTNKNYKLISFSLRVLMWTCFLDRMTKFVVWISCCLAVMWWESGLMAQKEFVASQIRQICEQSEQSIEWQKIVCVV